MATDAVFTLQDLRTAEFAATPLAVLGHPIGHSLSPRMHHAALSHLAQSDPRFRAWRYERFDISPDELPAALRALADRGFRGVNLTVPHKVLAFEHGAEIDAGARPSGAVNTLLRVPSGWKGFNTDGYGLAMGIRETLGLDLAAQSVVLLGAGGAARAAAVECLARGCARLAIGNRTSQNRSALLELLRPLAGRIALSGFDPAHGCEESAGALIINATSAGLKPDDAPPLDLRRVPRPLGVYDMIYNPPRTALWREAETLGIPAANGLSMLVHQGAKALEIWSGVPATVTAPVMAAALR
jgi:shikimate dehydrogenase